MSKMRNLWDYVDGTSSATDASETSDGSCPAVDTSKAASVPPEGPVQVTLDNPEIDPEDIEQNYQVDAELEEKMAEVARQNMPELFKDGVETSETGEAVSETGEAVSETGEAVSETGEAVSETGEAVGEIGGEVTTGTGEVVAGDGLLATVAPVAIPVAAGLAAFFVGEDSAVPEDEEQAMLAESKRKEAERKAAEQQ